MHGNTKKAFSVLFWAVTAVTVYWLFKGSFSSYFFQDDWFSLQISNAKSAREVLQFFIPRTDVIYYRPLGMQMVFFVFQSLFRGLSPVFSLPFRIMTLLIHLANSYLVYRLLRVLLKNTRFGYIGAFFYAVSAVHFTVFYWAATIAFAMAPFFYFSAFLFFTENKIIKSLLLFILGLLTNELLITFPAILFLWSLLEGKKLKKTVWFWAVVGVYIAARFIVFPPPTTGSYSVAYAPLQILLNFRDYVLWSFNFPEEIHNQFINWFVLNSSFVKEFFPYLASFFASFFGFSMLILIGTIFLIVRANSRTSTIKNIVFGLMWFVITLSPVLFFSSHAFSYYLAIPLLGVFIVLFTLMGEVANKNPQLVYGGLALFCLVWVISSYQSVRFNTFIHWAPRRAALSLEVLGKLQAEVSQPNWYAQLHVPKGDEYFWALSDQRAVQVYFDNPTLKTIYDK